jgi:hypothetical protein
MRDKYIFVIFFENHSLLLKYKYKDFMIQRSNALMNYSKSGRFFILFLAFHEITYLCCIFDCMYFLIKALVAPRCTL